jgi:hypothetical protein
MPPRLPTKKLVIGTSVPRVILFLDVVVRSFASMSDRSSQVCLAAQTLLPTAKLLSDGNGNTHNIFYHMLALASYLGLDFCTS